MTDADAVLRRIDNALGNCVCGEPLTLDGGSLDYCSEDCQEEWQEGTVDPVTTTVSSRIRFRATGRGHDWTAVDNGEKTTLTCSCGQFTVTCEDGTAEERDATVELGFNDHLSSVAPGDPSDPAVQAAGGTESVHQIRNGLHGPAVPIGTYTIGRCRYEVDEEWIRAILPEPTDRGDHQ